MKVECNYCHSCGSSYYRSFVRSLPHSIYFQELYNRFNLTEITRNAKQWGEPTGKGNKTKKRMELFCTIIKQVQWFKTVVAMATETETQRVKKELSRLNGEATSAVAVTSQASAGSFGMRRGRKIDTFVFSSKK